MWRHAALTSMPLEELHFALMFFRGGSGVERSEVAPLSGLRIGLARVEAKSARGKLSDHGISPRRWKLTDLLLENL
jgi:hypothetical protein